MHMAIALFGLVSLATVVLYATRIYYSGVIETLKLNGNAERTSLNETVLKVSAELANVRYDLESVEKWRYAQMVPDSPWRDAVRSDILKSVIESVELVRWKHGISAHARVPFVSFVVDDIIPLIMAYAWKSAICSTSACAILPLCVQLTSTIAAAAEETTQVSPKALPTLADEWRVSRQFEIHREHWEWVRSRVFSRFCKTSLQSFAQ